jgi:aspartate-semialdehyde dehydrogenase
METKVKNDPVVAIAGVTGAVGAEFIATVDKRAFRVGDLDGQAHLSFAVGRSRRSGRAPFASGLAR